MQKVRTAVMVIGAILIVGCFIVWLPTAIRIGSGLMAGIVILSLWRTNPPQKQPRLGNSYRTDRGIVSLNPSWSDRIGQYWQEKHPPHGKFVLLAFVLVGAMVFEFMLGPRFFWLQATITLPLLFWVLYCCSRFPGRLYDA